MNPVRAAIYDLLSSDAGLLALLADPPAGEDSSVYHRRAPQAAPSPYVIFNRQASTEVWQMADASIENQVWLLKAVARDDWPNGAEAIDERIRDLTLAETLTITGQQALCRLRRESGVSYDEPGDSPVWHEGGLYRLWTERT